MLRRAVADADEQGHDVDGLAGELEALPDSYDELVAFAQRLAGRPIRADWPYVEPDDLEAIRSECDPGRPTGMLAVDDPAARVRAAFLARVSGCMLGKPFEVDVGFDEIRAALESAGEWPLSAYASGSVVRALPELQGQWRELVAEHIDHVAPDDDINYTILAMLALEQHGAAFTHDDLRRLWLYNLPVLVTFGPERTELLAAGLGTHGGVERILNPGAELCGALIRADAYGYACVGRPELAAELAHRDASLTHRRTGVYGAMFVAAAIAVAPVCDDPLDIVRTALGFVPQRSRFADAVRGGLRDVESASDWIDAYERIHMRFGSYGFCRIYQEIGTVINTLRYASDAGDGICIQVMQGNDTDSFGATAGSILGAHFGTIDGRWIEPFDDDVRTALATFHERSLERITGRMAALPSSVSGTSA
jgi:ADP-ribosylglycohydrolase